MLCKSCSEILRNPNSKIMKSVSKKKFTINNLEVTLNKDKMILLKMVECANGKETCFSQQLLSG